MTATNEMNLETKLGRSITNSSFRLLTNNDAFTDQAHGSSAQNDQGDSPRLGNAAYAYKRGATGRKTRGGDSAVGINIHCDDLRVGCNQRIEARIVQEQGEPRTCRTVIGSS